MQQYPSNNRIKLLGLNISYNKNIVILAEIISVFLVAMIIIQVFKQPGNEGQIANLAVVWVANIIMLMMILMYAKIRGESLRDFGLGFSKLTFKICLAGFSKSLLVFIFAMLAFVVGSIIMANIIGVPEAANMTQYDYLKDNLPMLIISLIGIWIVSSFGEEVIYRGFLIQRFTQLGIPGKWASTIVVIMSSIIFGLAHYTWGLMGIVQTFFMGLALSISYLKLKRKLWILILAHAYMDTILMIQMYMASNS